MNIDKPGPDPRPLGIARTTFDVEAGVFGARGFAAGLSVDDAFSSGAAGFFAERLVAGDPAGVRGAGRFLFSAMRLEIIPSVGGRDQCTSAPFIVELSNCTR